MSNSSNPMEVLLSSPYLSEISMISSRITPRSFFSSARMALNSSIFASSSLNSFSSFSRSRPVRARRRISTIAWDWTSLKPKRSMSSAFAIWTFCELRIIRITSSILSRAISKPCKIWARSSALFKSYWVLLVTTSFWCAKYSLSICIRFKTRGSLLTSASIMTPNVSCNWVCFKSWFKITLALTSRRSSMTILIPVRSDSSRKSVIPSIFFSFASSAIFSIRRALFTM